MTGRLHALLYEDAGTLSTFDFPGPDAPLAVGGEIVMDTFDITSGIPVVLPETGRDLLWGP